MTDHVWFSETILTSSSEELPVKSPEVVCVCWQIQVGWDGME
jgi:hypothetical protein